MRSRGRGGKRPAPQGLVMMAVAPLSSRLTQARGPKVTLMPGTGTVAAGYAVNTVLMSQVWQLVLVSCVIGAGVGLGYGAMPSLLAMALASFIPRQHRDPAPQGAERGGRAGGEPVAATGSAGSSAVRRP